jgi:hypothetical protein
MTFEQAAGFPVTYGTVYYALVDRGRLKAGEVLMVHGAAGGVGSNRGDRQDPRRHGDRDCRQRRELAGGARERRGPHDQLLEREHGTAHAR